MQALTEILWQADWLEARLDLTQALQLLSQAIVQQPGRAELWARRAESLKNLGQTAAASQDLQQALQILQADESKDSLAFARMHSRLIMMNWSLASEWKEIESDLLRFRHWHGGKAKGFSTPRPRRTGPLRVGLLSPDFRPCSAALLLSVLAQNQPQADQAELIAYSLVTSEEPIQAHFQSLLPHWLDLSTCSAIEIASQIHNDRIDILIDLAGHTSLNGLAVLALQAAPVQISGLTFNGPSGLQETNYQITDAICTPHALLGETPLYLPSWIHWPKPPFSVLQRNVKDLPAHGYRLGCAHHPGRLSPQTLNAWSEILIAHPHSSLVLKHRLYTSILCRQSLLSAFAQRGIPASRIQFEGASDYRHYFDFYQQLDLVLDPFPYHGGLVSCEALWMGLPLVTLASWMCGGASLLKQVDFEAGIAQDAGDYCQRASQILASLELRQQAALHFRSRLQNSPVMQSGSWSHQFWSVLLATAP